MRGTDGISRLLATAVGEAEGWTIVLDNRPGAGSNIGMDAAAKAEPDGYTIVMGEPAKLAINPYLYKSMPFDPAKDVVPVALVGTVPLVLVVSSALPIEIARTSLRRLGFLTFGSSAGAVKGGA